jgi:hypothetical protein
MVAKVTDVSHLRPPAWDATLMTSITEKEVKRHDQDSLDGANTLTASPQHKSNHKPAEDRRGVPGAPLYTIWAPTPLLRMAAE